MYSLPQIICIRLCFALLCCGCSRWVHQIHCNRKVVRVLALIVKASTPPVMTRTVTLTTFLYLCPYTHVLKGCSTVIGQYDFQGVHEVTPEDTINRYLTTTEDSKSQSVRDLLERSLSALSTTPQVQVPGI